MSTQWLPLSDVELSNLAQVRLQFHQGVQNVAAVGRRFLEKSKEDEQSTLIWFPGLNRLAGKWITSTTTFRSSISFDDFAIYLVDSQYNTLATFFLHEKNHRQALVWLEEQIALLGLDTSQLTLNLPYELPAEVSKVGKPFFLPDLNSAKELGRYFHNGYLVLSEVQAAFKSSEVRCWPKNFDLSTRIIVNNTGNPKTSSFVTIGLSPGDQEFEEPYFYVAPWPYPATEALPSLTHGRWVEEHWIGAVLPAAELVLHTDQHKVVKKFMSECFSVLRKVMIY